MLKNRKLPKYHRFNGKLYRLKWRKPYRGMGLCECPDAPPKDRVITVDPKLSAKDFCETLIHEALHAEQWYLDENTVERISSNLVELLDRCNLLIK